jgi:hypothetical protein
MTLHDFLDHLRQLNSLPDAERHRIAIAADADAARREHWWLRALLDNLSALDVEFPPLAPAIMSVKFARRSSVLPRCATRHTVAVYVFTHTPRRSRSGRGVGQPAPVIGPRRLGALLELVLQAIDDTNDPYLHLTRIREATPAARHARRPASLRSDARSRITAPAMRRPFGTVEYRYAIHRSEAGELAMPVTPMPPGWPPAPFSSPLAEAMLRSLTVLDVQAFLPALDVAQAVSAARHSRPVVGAA